MNRSRHITQRTSQRTSRRGAALILVLLLAATLSFVALAITEKATEIRERASGLRFRGEAQWVALGAEQLALSTVEAALKAAPGRQAASDPWVNRPLTFPLEGGGAATALITDATRCFNVNSFAPPTNTGQQSQPQTGAQTGPQIGPSAATKEFLALLPTGGSAGLSAQALAAEIGDWIDPDSFAAPQGAEDNLYLSAKTPYRTGQAIMADVTEILALRDMTADTYKAVAPYLCARPDATPSVVNVNMLQERDAPILASIFKGAMTEGQALAIIHAVPPGGYGTAAAFFANPLLKQQKVDDSVAARFDVVSRYLKAEITIERGGARFEMSSLLEMSGDGKMRVVSRRFGPEE